MPRDDNTRRDKRDNATASVTKRPSKEETTLRNQGMCDQGNEDEATTGKPSGDVIEAMRAL